MLYHNGGPQATFLPHDALHELDAIDLICRSEGEDTLLSLARSLEESVPLVGLDGLLGRDPEGKGTWEGLHREGDRISMHTHHLILMEPSFRLQERTQSFLHQRMSI